MIHVVKPQTDSFFKCAAFFSTCVGYYSSVTETARHLTFRLDTDETIEHSRYLYYSSHIPDKND